MRGEREVKDGVSGLDIFELGVGGKEESGLLWAWAGLVTRC